MRKLGESGIPPTRGLKVYSVGFDSLLDVPQASSASGIPMVVSQIARESEEVFEKSAALPEQPETARIFHCAGDAYGLVLGDLLEFSYRAKLKDYNGLYLVVEGKPPAEPLSFSVEQVRAQGRRRWNQFES